MLVAWPLGVPAVYNTIGLSDWCAIAFNVVAEKRRVEGKVVRETSRRVVENMAIAATRFAFICAKETITLLLASMRHGRVVSRFYQLVC